MKAVILAAGFGTRMSAQTPKSLVKVAGREIIYRTMKILSDYVDEFIVVVGKNGKKIDNFLKDKDFNYRIIRNPNPERGNGYSFYLTKDVSGDRFILVMGDHIYEEEFIKRAVKGEGLIGDRNPAYVDLEESTKVRCKDGRIEDIGKKLEEFDFVDTGFFILSKDIYEHAESIVREKEVVELSEIVKKAKIPVTELSGYFWMDVDTIDDLKKARKFIVRSSVKGFGDGFVAKHFNRRISLRLSELLVDHLTPNQMTVISFLSGILSSLTLFFSIPLAGIAYQLSSIIDGCDGEIARASLRKSKLGEYADSMLDRYVDFIFLVVLGYVSNLSIYFWMILVFAIFGSVMISYSTEKYKAAFSESAYGAIPSLKYLIGKRDERIFVIMIFCLASLIESLILILAIWTNIRVLAILLIVYKNKKGI